MSHTIRQAWDAAQYEKNGRFVADLAGGVLELLDPRPGERILDLGCGDGALTLRLREAGAEVVGVDASSEMVQAAKARGLDARVMPGEALSFDGEFDAVFSNAALHWIHGQRETLAGVRRALRSGGRFVAEMGGHGNIAAIRVALNAVLWPLGFDGDDGHNFFPTPATYREMLETAGFEVRRIAIVERQTPLPASGMRGWLETFRRGLLERVPAERREQVIEDAVALLRPVFCDEKGNWVADYVRLRFVAVAPSS